MRTQCNVSHCRHYWNQRHAGLAADGKKVKGAVCRIQWHLAEQTWHKWNIILMTMFKLVFNPFENKNLIFLLPQNEPFKYTQGVGPLRYSQPCFTAMFTVAQNGQTNHWLQRGPLLCFPQVSQPVGSSKRLEVEGRSHQLLEISPLDATQSYILVL